MDWDIDNDKDREMIGTNKPKYRDKTNTWERTGTRIESQESTIVTGSDADTEQRQAQDRTKGECVQGGQDIYMG